MKKFNIDFIEKRLYLMGITEADLKILHTSFEEIYFRIKRNRFNRIFIIKLSLILQCTPPNLLITDNH